MDNELLLGIPVEEVEAYCAQRREFEGVINGIPWHLMTPEQKRVWAHRLHTKRTALADKRAELAGKIAVAAAQGGFPDTRGGENLGHFALAAARTILSE